MPPISLLERRKGWLKSEIDEIVNTMVSGVPTDAVKILVADLVEQRQCLRSKALEEQKDD